MNDIAIRVENLSKQYPSTALRQPFDGAQDKAQDKPHRWPFTSTGSVQATGLRTGPPGRYKTIRESLTEAVGAPFRRLTSVVRGQSSTVSNETIWALKDVSLQVQRGEVVGIPSLRLGPSTSRVVSLSNGSGRRVEIKAVRTLAPEHEARLLNYPSTRLRAGLKATPYEVGLLLNPGCFKWVGRGRSCTCPGHPQGVPLQPK
jgi:hypothetical protein